MQYQATAKYLRTSPRKLRLVADAVKNLTPKTAMTQLAAMPKRAGQSLATVIQSALANANQKQAKEELLQFASIEIMGGPPMKRWRAVSRGQAHTYKKRMSHIKVVLTDEGGKH